MVDTRLEKINKLINSTTTEGLAYSLERSDRLVNLITIMAAAREITNGIHTEKPVNMFVNNNKIHTVSKDSVPAPPTINPDAIDDSFIVSPPDVPSRPFLRTEEADR